MKRASFGGIVLSLTLAVAGCSDATVEKAKDAAESTGEAVKSAAKDAAANTEKAADKVKAAVDEAVDGDEADSGATDAK